MKIPLPKKTSVHRAKKPGASTQKHLRFGEIKKGIVVMKDGSLRAVLRVSSVNFNLKSEEEQNSIIFGFQDFLNMLDFPVQLLVRSRKLQLDNYLLSIEKQAQKQTNPLLKRQTFEYLEYISKLIDLTDIMKKDFFVVVPYDPPIAASRSFLEKMFGQLHPSDSLSALQSRTKSFDRYRKTLQRRVAAVKSALASCRLRCEQLKTDELIELFYECYNPLTSREEKVSAAADLELLENRVDLEGGLEKEGEEEEGEEEGED